MRTSCSGTREIRPVPADSQRTATNRRRRARLGSPLFCFAWCVALWIPPSDLAMAYELMIFAGPHKTSETSVEEFFWTYARGAETMTEDDPNETDRMRDWMDSTQRALQDWVWPHIESPVVDALDIEKHHVFGQLVINAESRDIQEIILDGIETTFLEHKEKNEFFRGVIIGTEEFDRMGPTPYSETNAIDAIERVRARLSLEKERTTVILLYRTPRLDQWLAIYSMIQNGFDGVRNELFGNNTISYSDFLCNNSYKHIAYNFLEEAMNTLFLAKEYADQGYNVKIIDLAGLERDRIDVEHYIGCQILKAECDSDGYLVNLRDETFLRSGGMHDSMADQADFDGLTRMQQDDLEQLFKLRDCHYSYFLDGGDPRIIIEHHYRMLADCDESRMQGGSDGDIPAYLSETEAMLNVLQAQVDCNAEEIDMREILLGNASSVYNGRSYDDASMNGQFPPWLIPAFLGAFIFAGIMGLVWMRSADARARGYYDETPTAPDNLDALSPRISEGRGSKLNLSMLT